MPVYEIELTTEEIETALLEARKKKWFHLQHAEHWENEEKVAEQLELEAKAKASLQRKLKKECILISA